MRILFTLSILIVLIKMAYAQSIITNTYFEQTFITPKIGTSVGYKFQGNFEVGGFFQVSTIEPEREIGRPLHYEKEFYGAFFAYPLMTLKKAGLKMKIRSGVTNGQNFIITPSLHATYKPVQLLTLSTGVGMRAFRPTVMASMQINLFGNPG